MLLFVVSCNNNSKKYQVLEVGEYGHVSGANHKVEIRMENKEYEKIIKPFSKTIKIEGIKYKAQYEYSRKGYLYQSDCDCFEINDGDRNIRLKINNVTGLIESYNGLDFKYINEAGGEKQTRDQCLEIAIDYFNKYADASEYTLVDERYLDFPKDNLSMYEFEFRRVIGGINTSERACIGVSIFGDVVSHSFTMLGKMKSAPVPSNEEFEIIEQNIDDKIKTIYANVSSKYDYTYSVVDTVLVRLSNGKYALEYGIDVELTPVSFSEAVHERTQLLVFLD
jgi:hypothetical protein